MRGRYATASLLCSCYADTGRGGNDAPGVSDSTTPRRHAVWLDVQVDRRGEVAETLSGSIPA